MNDSSIQQNNPKDMEISILSLFIIMSFISNQKIYLWVICFFTCVSKGRALPAFFFATGVSGIGISFHDSYLRILYCFLYHCFLEDWERNYKRKRNDSRIIKAERSTEWVSCSIMEVHLLLMVGDLFVSWVLHSLILRSHK